MTPHHLLVHLIDNVIYRELAALFRDPRKEGDLEKQIAQLFAQIVRTSQPRLFQRVKRFVGFLQKHWRQRRICLFAVPRTTAGRTQTIH